MNYLVHLHLSDPTPGCLLGNLMGDFVKGRLPEDYPPQIRFGLAMHRRVDTFANSSPAFLRSKSRLDPRYHYFRAIMVDVFYDHFMARYWEEFASEPLEVFARRIYRFLDEHFADLPPGLQAVAPRMISHNWLVSYRQQATIGRVLERLSKRLTRANPLGEGLAQLEQSYPLLKEDFREFLEEARTDLERWRRDWGTRPEQGGKGRAQTK